MIRRAQECKFRELRFIIRFRLLHRKFALRRVKGIRFTSRLSVPVTRSQRPVHACGHCSLRGNELSAGKECHLCIVSSSSVAG